MDAVLLRRKAHDLQNAFLRLHCRSQHILTAYNQGACLVFIRAIGMKQYRRLETVPPFFPYNPAVPYIQFPFCRYPRHFLRDGNGFRKSLRAFYI